MKSQEAPQPKNFEDIMRVMRYVQCPKCEQFMLPDIGVADPLSRFPRAGKTTIIDPDGNEVTLLYARLRCDSCDIVLPVSSFEVQ